MEQNTTGSGPSGESAFARLMPLMNAAYGPGSAEAFVSSLGAGPLAAVAHAELAYFSGRADEAVSTAAPLLKSVDPGTRLSACLICAYANLALGRIQDARYALSEARGALARRRR